MTKPAFILNNRNKEKLVYRSVKGALSQTVACEILIADFASTDNSRQEIERALSECRQEADHEVRFLKVDEPTESSMVEMNKNLLWMIRETKAEWVFQSSSDDYSLPARVAVCMRSLQDNPCAAIATTQFYEDPAKPGERLVSGFPTQTGYVKGGEGVANLAYGSCIAAYSREFIERVGSAGPNTPDVYWGYLASLDKGFFVVASPQHVHCNVSDLENVGFGGKLAAATGDEALKLNELNHFQLLRIYYDLAEKVNELHPQGVAPEDWGPLMQTIIGQAGGWLRAREALHAKRIAPGVM